MNLSVFAKSGGYVHQNLPKLRGNRPGVVAALFTVFLFIAGCGGSTKTAAPTPTFTPGAGPYSTTQNVTVSDTNPNAALYCTNDGSAPTVSSPQCANPIKVSQSQTLNAIAIAPGMDASAVATASYTISASTAAPVVQGIGPATGSSAGGTSVTIVGINFTGVTAVNFGTNQAASFKVNSATSITAVSPAGSGSAHITVVAAGGTSATTSADVFSYGTVPSITGLSPASATVGSAGITLTVSGTNFTSDATVQWNGASLTATYVGSTSLTATVPASLLAAAGTASVTVKESGGASAGVSFAINAAAPSIIGISPSQGPSAGGTSVNITGTNFTAVSAVKFGAASAASFTVNSATSITAVSPGGSVGPVDIQVLTPSGASTTGTSDQFTYLAAPAVTSVSPATGSTAGGAAVTISGLNFTGATSVSFGATAAAGFTVNSATGITAIAPPGSAGTVDIRVVTPGGASVASGADQFIYAVPVPTVTGLSVTAGRIAGGTTVNITGTNFTGATAVNFGNTPAASFQAVSATSITAVTQAESAGTVNVTVTTQYGTSTTNSADQFTFTSAPIVTNVSPSAGPLAGGTVVTIQGDNFVSGATTVNFNGKPATAVSVSVDGTSLTATSPSSGSAGTVDIQVVTAGGSSATGSAADQFTYVPAPTVTGISPTTGSTGGGTAVTITGTNFSGTGYTVTAVNFNGVAATIGSVSADGLTIIATTPAGSAGPVNITVVTPGGSVTSATQFTYALPPDVQSIAPSSGPTTGGTSVSITGSGFTGATEVDFGSTAVTTGLSVNTDGTSITATTPAGSVGVVDVKVVTPIGSDTLTGGFTYTPVISGRVGSGPSTSFTAISGATVRLYAAGTTGYGEGTDGPALIDTTPGTVTTDASGNFSFQYSCPQTSGGDQMYLVATSQTNSDVVLMTALGSCANIATAFPGGVTVNEATTIASAFALAGFANADTTAGHGIDVGAPTGGASCNATAGWKSTGASTCNYIGLKNAFATVTNLVDIPSGQVLAITPAYCLSSPCVTATASNTTPYYATSIVPQGRINAMANALAACVNPTSGTPANCSALLTATEIETSQIDVPCAPTNLNAPADTLQAALNIAHFPGDRAFTACGVDVLSGAGILRLISATNPPYTPTLTSSTLSALGENAYDLSLALIYQGGGLGGTNVAGAPTTTGLAIDAGGNIWVPTQSSTGGSVAVVNNQGAPISAAGNSSTNFGGYTTGVYNPQSIAIDLNGNAWIGNSPADGNHSLSDNGSLSEIQLSGSSLTTPQNGLTAPAVTALLTPAQYGLAIDAGNNVWLSSNPDVGGSLGCNGGTYGGSILKFDNSGNLLNGPDGYLSYNDNSSCPAALAFDGSGLLWTWDNGMSGNDPYIQSLLQLVPSSGTVAGSPYMASELLVNPFYGGNNFCSFIGSMSASANMAIDSAGDSWFASSGGSWPCMYVIPNMTATGASAAISQGTWGWTLTPDSWNVEVEGPTVIDGGDNAWATTLEGGEYGLLGYNSENANSTYEATATDTALLAPQPGYIATDPSVNASGRTGGTLALFGIGTGLGVDGSGNLWVSGGASSASGVLGSQLMEFIGIAVPAQTPLSSALTNKNLGAKP